MANNLDASAGFLDFDLEIAQGTGRDYPVAVVRSPAGEARATMRFPFDDLALESRLDKLQIALLRSGGKLRQVLTPEESAVQDFGKQLFDALFVGEVGSRYAVSHHEATTQGKGLRLKLRIAPPQLARLPWEFLYDTRQSDYVCLSTKTPVVRYLELPQPIQPLSVAPPLRVLGMIASPSDLPELDTAREKQRIDDATRDLQTRGLIELTWLDGQTWRDLQRAMRTGAWHIFHFIGHGGFDRYADEGLIALADDAGKSANLNASQLGRLLADYRSLRLVLLNSCEGARGSDRDLFSSTASILVRRGIPAVLAMQYEITDRAAIEFARAFYEAIADNSPVDAATSEARKAISIAVTNTIEWGTPVLFMRAPDGVLFNLHAQSDVERRAQEAARLEQERKEREAREQAAKEEAARLARLEQERKEREAREQAAREEAARLARLEQERKEREARAQAAKEETARLARLEQVRNERGAREQEDIELASLEIQLFLSESKSNWDKVIELGERILKLNPNHPSVQSKISQAKQKRDAKTFILNRRARHESAQTWNEWLKGEYQEEERFAEQASAEQNFAGLSKARKNLNSQDVEKKRNALRYLLKITRASKDKAFALLALTADDDLKYEIYNYLIKDGKEFLRALVADWDSANQSDIKKLLLAIADRVASVEGGEDFGRALDEILVYHSDPIVTDVWEAIATTTNDAIRAYAKLRMHQLSAPVRFSLTDARRDWLQKVGGTNARDPFITRRAENEDERLRNSIAMVDFAKESEKLDQPRTQILFAVEGGGKTTARKQLAQRLKTQNQFVIECSDIVDIRSRDTDILETQVAQILRAGVSALLSKLFENPRMLSIDPVEKQFQIENMKWHFVNLLGESAFEARLDEHCHTQDQDDSLGRDLVFDLRTAKSRTSIGVNPTCREMLDGFKHLCARFGYARIWVLIDGLDDRAEFRDQPAWIGKTLAPLLGARDIIQREGWCFKFFLPTLAKKDLEKYRDPISGGIETLEIVWSRAKLKEALDHRLYDALRKDNLQALSSQGAQKIEKAVLDAAEQSPGKMFWILSLLLDKIAERWARDGADRMITERDWARVVWHLGFHP